MLSDTAVNNHQCFGTARTIDKKSIGGRGCYVMIASNLPRPSSKNVFGY